MTKNTSIQEIYPNFKCLDDHPLVNHKLTILRDKTTQSKEFREILEEVTFLVAAQALAKLNSSPKTVETPLTTYHGTKVNPVTLIPIIRAGVAMMSPLQKLLPDATVGFIGISRDHDTLEAKQYYRNIPKINSDHTALILDPMLATGNTVTYTLKCLKEQNIKNIIIISILAAKPALDAIFSQYPDCLVYSAGYDEHLNDIGYITPGLGDAGDRIFNTVG